MKMSMEFDRFDLAFPLTSKFIQSLVHHDLPCMDDMNQIETEAFIHSFLTDVKDDDYFDIVADKDFKTCLISFFTDNVMSTWNIKALLVDLIMQTWDEQFDEIFEYYRDRYIEELDASNLADLDPNDLTDLTLEGF